MGQRRVTVKFFREQLLAKASSAPAGPRSSACLADPFCLRFFLRPPGLGCNNRDTSRMLKSLRMSYAYCSHINHIQNNSNTIPVQFCIRATYSHLFISSDGFSISLCSRFSLHKGSMPIPWWTAGDWGEMKLHWLTKSPTFSVWVKPMNPNVALFL